MGAEDELYSGFGGGDHSQGTHLQLTLLPTVEEQQNTIEQAEAEKAPAFVVSQEDIDAVLQEGSDYENGKYRIYEQFQKGLSPSENARFLKEEYGTGSFTDVNGLKGSYDGKGIRIYKTVPSSPIVSIALSWNKAAKRIAELVKLDRYLSAKEKAYYPTYLEQVKERRQRADEIAAARKVLSRAPQENAPAKRESARYEYHLGDTVYLGAQEYEILAFDENEVRLFDVSFPLINKVLPRAEFDEKVRANPMNSHLTVSEETEPPALLEAKRLINAYCMQEFEQEADFSDLHHIDLAMAETYDGEHTVEISADLVDFRLVYQVDGETVSTISCKGLSDLNEYLANLSIDDMVDHALEQYETRQPPSRSDEMLRQAEQIAAISALPPEERFSLIETDEGYAIWDDVTEAVYVDDEGVSEEFTSEWQAQAYLEEVKKAVSEKESAEWLAVERAKLPPLEYAAGDRFVIFSEDGKESSEFVLTRIEENEVWYTFPDLPQQPPVSMRREEFENNLRSGHIREQQAEASLERENGEILGKELTIDGHRFVVDRISDFSGDVTLRDITFEGNTGFPINRMENIDTVRRLLQQQEQPKQEEPVKLRSVVIDLTPKTEAEKPTPPYIADDSFLVFDAAGKIQSEIQILRITNEEITYATPVAPGASPVTMRREEFDQNLQNGRFRRKDSVPLEMLEQEEQYLLGEGDILTIDGKRYALVSFGDETSTVRALDESQKIIRFSTDELLKRLRKSPENDRYLQNPYDLGVFGELLPAEEAPVKKEELPAPPPVRRKMLAPSVLHPEIPTSERHNFRITDDHLGEGGAKTKFKNNVAAIRTLQEIEFDNRLATPEEQEILSRYVGWGGLPQAFDENNEQWADEFIELYGLLSPEEYEAAKSTTLNAHYTSPTVIKAIYQVVENMGFRTGNILEPSCGIGNFFGLVPESLNESKLFGVELDSITGRIAQQLYQQNSIAVQGFEDTELPDSFFDLAIGNVPFGSYSVHDKRYNKHHFLIHDYFFAKTIDKVRPGGIVAFITSKGTLDKQNPEVRKYIAERAELIGAIRLPNNAFLANAGTKVTADVIFLQKRDKLIDVSMPEADSGLEWLHLGQTENGVPINQYFIDHPEMVLGEMDFDNSMYGNAKETTCKPFEGQSLSDLLAEAVQNLHAEYTDYEIEELDGAEEDKSIPADPNVRNFSFTLVDGAIYYRENSRMFPVEQSLTGQSRVKGMIAIRDCARRLIEYQTENAPDETIKREQHELNLLYDKFTAKYGLINSRANTTAFFPDSSFPLLSSLEILDEDGNLERKADIFQKRTIKPYIAVTRVDTASEALAVSIGEKACVDLGFMASLMGGSEKIEQIKRDLAGVIFKDPDSGDAPFVGWQTADEYLSGKVRDKLKRARQAAEKNPAYAVNVEALEKVQPKDLTAGEISLRLGTTWIPEDVIEDFTFELLGTPWNYERQIHICYSKVTGEWNVSGKSLDRSNIRSYNTYGTQRINAYKIIEDTLNLRDVRIFDTKHDAEGKEIRVLNKKETAIAQDKQDLIQQKFQEWVWADSNRRNRLCRIYNEKYNSIRPREYDGSHLVFAGMNPEMELRPHQRNAVARAIYGGNTLFGHVVGAGKTFAMIATAMEAKRLGLSNKSLFVVPNNIIGDFASDFLKLYPSANILMATKKDFEKQNRKKFCARIATGDYDGIIIGHSQFEKIPLSVERQQAMIKKQIAEVVAGIAAIKYDEGSRFTVKQMEKSKKSLEAKLKKLNDQSRKDDVVTFEELGVDRLFIDEADLFKNLYLYTKMRNVGGISQTEALKASDLFMKCRYLDELTNYKGVVFATGTPVSNSMCEMYTMQRYLQYQTLDELELTHFDSWAAQFGETTCSMELKPEGTGFQQKTRFSSFHNLPELMAVFKEVADIQTADMLHLPVPKANYETVVCKPSEMQKKMVLSFAARADAVRNGTVDSTVDNMLLITNDGRKLALDQRLLNPMLPDFEGSKVNVCADNVYRIWEETKEQRLTQLIFCDLSTPGKKKIEMQENDDGTFAAADFQNVYEDLRNKLIDRGIPAEEIAFVHEANNETQKKELFSKVRRGKIRVLIGSTPRMGAGTNVQDKLIALHDLDCPWRPRDLEQRSGRIIRQGNQNEEVQIYRYVTEGTFDSYLYQMVENKQRFISQVFTSKSPARIMQEIDDAVLSYNEIKALATGNPMIIEHANLESEVSKLKMLNASHLNQKYELEDKVLKYYPQEIKRLNERISGYTADIARREENTPAKKEDFPPMQIHGTVYTEKAEAGKALIEACKQLTNLDSVSIGSYRGFEMQIFYGVFSKEYQVSLKGQLTHTVSLGTDIRGNITRLDNALHSLEERLQEDRDRLENTKTQMEAAKADAEKPFPREQELQEKSKRLAELTKLLKMDEKDRELLDSAPDEGDERSERKAVGLER
ncbi:MAG: DEAD/DEAH box helicase family protein [Ruminococcus sp.]|nr:DEAD/DEAH box helicase family protein [Ruminococcus sp.]